MSLPGTYAAPVASSRCGPPRLTPVTASNGRFAVGLYDGLALRYLTGPDLVPEARVGMPALLNW